MKKRLRCPTSIVGALLLFASIPGHAQLVDNGDTTLDTNTGLEWLDLTLTVGQSYDDMIAGFGGYVADGWTHATTEQVCELFAALGDNIVACLSANNADADPLLQANADTFTLLLGNTYEAALDPDINTTCGIFDGGFVTLGAAAINAGVETACISNSTPDASRLLSGIPTSFVDPFIGHWLVREANMDSDGDGVNDDVDNCPNTVIPEDVPLKSLKKNRWALIDDDLDFDEGEKSAKSGKSGKSDKSGKSGKSAKSAKSQRSYSTTDTAGCSCEQILDAQGLDQSQTDHGCKNKTMDDWVELVTP